ncbi:MAG: Uma2 family endonuclease [Acidimicrobiales bacterium]
MDTVTSEPVKHLITAEEYEAMGASAIFLPDQRLELIEGEIVEMAPIGPPHASVVTRLTRVLIMALGETAEVRVQSPVRLSDISEPQPDLVVARSRADFYAERHPLADEILLAVEVSDSTLRWDRSVKTPLYARAGVVELWVVDVNARTVEVCTGPGQDGYSEVRTIGLDGEIDLCGLDGVVIRVADFLG